MAVIEFFRFLNHPLPNNGHRVLGLLKKLPRELFVPPQDRDLAFADLNLPISHGQCMMQPKVEARLAQALALTSTDRVLEVGTGTGYLTALLASCCAQVTSIDIHGDFLKPASARLERLGIVNATFLEGDAAEDWAEDDGWDAIILTGSVPVPPHAHCNRLAAGGRLVAIVGQPPVMEAMLYSIAAAMMENRLNSLFLTPAYRP